ncbi:hypothetical protein ACJ5NV_02430 [Loktanella agnita]|uniref:hypothetical protein n=1 Tax=Loktanella agnita TaxID=287097 RepID=UPI0039865B36
MIGLLQRIKPKPKSEHWEDYFHGRETLLWEGKPEPGGRTSVGMIFMTVFGLPFLFTGLATFGTGLAGIFSGDVNNLGGGIFMVLFALPFVGAGAALVFGPWITNRYAHQLIRYAVTNKRAYIATSWWQHTMQSYPITGDNSIELQEGRFDTVYFFTEVTTDSDGDRKRRKIGFEHIANGMAVYKLLRDVQAKAIERDKHQT